MYGRLFDYRIVKLNVGTFSQTGMSDSRWVTDDVGESEVTRGASAPSAYGLTSMPSHRAPAAIAWSLMRPVRCTA
jgi:hypothetical protein